MNYNTLRSIIAVILLGTALFMTLSKSHSGATRESQLISDNASVTSDSFYQSDQPYRTENFTVTGRANVLASTSGGNITVEGSDGNEVRVEMYVRKRGRNLSPSDTDLSDYDIDLSMNGNEVRAIAKRKSGSGSWFNMGNSPSISFVIHAPAGSDTDLGTSGGNVSVASLNGTQKLKTSGGNVSLTNITGNSDGRTSGGNIQVADYEGDLNIQTSGGNLNISKYTGELTARTSGGRISLDEVSGKISARTSGGSISGTILAARDVIDLQTSGGNIDVKLPADTGMKLNVRGSRVSSSLDGFKGTIESGKIDGSIGNEAVEVSIRTSGGSVKLAHY
jgi:hypothetical protein